MQIIQTTQLNHSASLTEWLHKHFLHKLSGCELDSHSRTFCICLCYDIFAVLVVAIENN